MAKSLVVTKIVLDRLPELQGQMRQRAGQAIRKAALDIEARAKAIVPVDTGNLKNSIQAQKEKEFTWIVGTHVEYAPYVEYGTYKMAARPYLGPAAEEVRPQLLAAIERFLE